jgi:hypothetical protein
MLNERRIQPRETVELAVSLPDGGQGVTRDVSSTGLHLEIDGHPLLGDVIELEISLDTGWGQLAFQARGEVVRLRAGASQSEPSEVSVRIVDSRLMPLD